MRVRRGPGRAGDLGVAASHQQVEIPLVSAQVIQHDLHAVRCDCGRVHQAGAAPASGMRSAGYLSTASKHGINKLSALRDALAGHPWMPPIPHPP